METTPHTTNAAAGEAAELAGTPAAPAAPAANKNIAVINKENGKRISIEDVKSAKPERLLEMLVKSGRYVYEGDKIEVDAKTGADIVQAEINRLSKEREEFEAEKAAFAAEKAAFEAYKAGISAPEVEENTASTEDSSEDVKKSGRPKKN